MLVLFSLLPLAVLASRDSCQADRDGFIDLPGLKYPDTKSANKGKTLWADLEETFPLTGENAVTTETACAEKCCANVNGHDIECKGYVFYSGKNRPSSWRCQIIFIKFWEYGQVVSSLAKKEGGVDIVTKMYKEGACSKISNAKFEDISQ